jgi:hypothetical protein
MRDIVDTQEMSTALKQQLKCRHTGLLQNVYFRIIREMQGRHTDRVLHQETNLQGVYNIFKKNHLFLW